MAKFGLKVNVLNAHA